MSAHRQPLFESVPALDLQGVDKRLGSSEVVRRFTMRVSPGERVAVIGPNGAGKTTLFNLISGRLVPDAGEIRLQGRAIQGLPAHQIARLGLARSFQISSLFPRLSAFENLRCAVLWRLGYRHAFWRRLSKAVDARDQALELLQRIGLASRADVPAQYLSYAEQRALEIGITLAGEAGVILLDEPTAGMNRSEAERCVQLIRQVTQGKTLLVVEHDMGVVFDLADRIAVMRQGELIALDTPERIRADERVQRAYLGQAGPGPHGTACSS